MKTPDINDSFIHSELMDDRRLAAVRMVVSDHPHVSIFGEPIGPGKPYYTQEGARGKVPEGCHFVTLVSTSWDLHDFWEAVQRAEQLHM